MRDEDSIHSLQGCINDLISLLALPALWQGGDSFRVIDVLLDVMMRMLCLDFAYVRLNDITDATSKEIFRITEGIAQADASTRIIQILQPWLGRDETGSVAVLANPVGIGNTAVARAWLGPSREQGVIVVGSNRARFPSEIELLLFRTAVNQAIIEFQRSEVYAAHNRAIAIEQQKDQLLVENSLLRRQLGCDEKFGELVGNSIALKRVMFLVTQVASTKACVLIQGETGTGKELIARAIHGYSSRKNFPFVKVNCAAIPSGLIEAELFGHEKGAYTGAVGQRIGRFELADQGTIFLDEVGEIPLELQAKLLRVLQEQEFERLGSSRTIRVDVRLVVATNRNLAQMVDEGTFRADLYYRLNVFPISVPPLRQRQEDIPLLVRHFVQQYAREYNKKISTITDKCMDMLCHYRWPGNIRELSNLIERGVILAQNSVLEIPMIESEQDQLSPTSGSNLKEFERDHILRVLDECGWVIAGPLGAAAKLGMKRTSLQYKMQQLGIVRPRQPNG